MRSWPNDYQVGDLVHGQLYDLQAVCKVVYKGPNYLELLDITNPAPEVCPQRVYAIGTDRDIRRI